MVHLGIGPRRGKGRDLGGSEIQLNQGRGPPVPATPIKSQLDPTCRACSLLMQKLISMRKFNFSFLCCKIFCSSNQQQRMILSKQLNTHPYRKQIICKQGHSLECVLTILNIEQICQNQILFTDNLWKAEKAKTANKCLICIIYAVLSASELSNRYPTYISKCQIQIYLPPRQVWSVQRRLKWAGLCQACICLALALHRAPLN